ncbi:DNase I-like protein [Polyporus arcularius HHB13444]|uniref:DNase I-like protein n=1 Tax=Polyporus arcularius HHB13444 TaxID=1314778 RepID=A0A5C3PCD0_9APHY|nr:DNase I-like protein [Polyporus arcularius HHB13444]
MRGYGEVRGGNVSEKWWRMNQMIRDEKIAVLAVQEAHLTQDRADTLNELFGATMKVWACADEEHPTGARGIAFVANRRLVAVDDACIKVLRPGRAATLTIPWSRGRKLKIMNVYAPNDARDNALFWSHLLEDRAQGTFPKPDIMLGDFNLVENGIDRLPPRKDNQEAVDNLRDLCSLLEVVDGLRERDPASRMYTYLQLSTGSQSRIDRIYHANEWDIAGPGIRTDHRLVTVAIANVEAPFVGKGRWSLPTTLLTDAIYLAELQKLGMALQKEIETIRTRSDERNPQTCYAKFKRDARDAARKRAKQCIPQLDRKIAALKKDVSTTLNKPVVGEEDRVNAAIIQEKLVELELRRFGRKRAAVAVNDWAHGEVICRYWTRLNAAQRPSTTGKKN